MSKNFNNIVVPRCMWAVFSGKKTQCWLFISLDIQRLGIVFLLIAGERA